MPIVDLQTYRQFLREDLKAYGLSKWQPWHAFKYPQLAFQRKLRACEFASGCLHGKFGKAVTLLLRFRARRAGIKLGFSIPPNVFGPGLCIVHWGTIVVNDQARVGARCRLHPCTLIGGKASGAPAIGDDVYIGNGAKIIGNVTLGDRIIIGANAVVTKSFDDDQTLVGMPAGPLAHKSRTPAMNEQTTS